MRVLLAATAIAALVPQAAAASSGGASAPASGSAPGAQPSQSGGAGAGDPNSVAAPRPRHGRPSSVARPVLASFSVSRSRIFAYGAPAAVRFRIDARAAELPVALDVYSGGRRVRSLALGKLSTGVAHSTPLRGAELPGGTLTVRVRAAHLRTGAHASGSSQLDNYSHRFPLAGPFHWPGAGGEFGAARSGHVHQGFDLLAATGVPVLAPRGGTVTTVAYQARAAGYYVVLRGAGEPYSYAFMHLRPGSTRVRVGQHVATGQRIGDVGATGDAAGPHLHFEVWRGLWQAGGRPIDPAPLLHRWLAWSP